MKLSFFLIFIFIDIYFEIINSNECPRETPLLDHTSQECTYEQYVEGVYEISNSIIKTQWLNQINQLGEQGFWYFGIDISSKGDIIIQSFIYDGINVNQKRYLYGIKNNGRSLFYLENSFTNQISINSNTNYQKFESEFLRIKLINDDENDYYLSPCFENNTIEIIDLYNNRIIGVPQAIIFGNVLIATKINSIFELNQNPKNYLFCFIGNNSPYYIVFQKLRFINVDISQSNNYEIVSSSQLKEELKVHKSLQITCIEISKYNIIQCFYINSTNYLTIGLFNEDSYDIIQSEIVEETYINETDIDCLECNFYYQCIHLKNEISILGYTLGANNHDAIYIQLKLIIYNNYYSIYELEDYLIRFKKIILKLEGKIDFDTYYYINHLKKINDNKFSLISTSEDNYQLYIFIFDLYNFHETN